MCYSASQLHFKAYKNAIHQGAGPEEVERLYREYLESYLDEEEVDKPINYKYFYVGGFENKPLTILSNSDQIVEEMNWGLIPHWIKSEQEAQKIKIKTLNARSETIFEKASYKESILKRRCLVVVPSYFEYHLKNGAKHPYRIVRKDKRQLILAGIWDEWKNHQTNKLERTFSIVTTPANDLLTEIHNTGKEARMPLILEKKDALHWLTNKEENRIQQLKQLMKTFPDNELEAYRVHQLIGKNGVGNSPLAITKKEDDVLTFDF